MDIIYFECLFCVFNSPLLLQKNSTSKSFYIMKIKGPFVKLVVFYGTVTGHGVTKQWSYADSDSNFCTVTWLAAHYVSLLQLCMAAALVWFWMLTTFEEDGTKLWQRRCWLLWLEAVRMHDGAGAENSRRRRAAMEHRVWILGEEAGVDKYLSGRIEVNCGEVEVFGKMLRSSTVS
jgi:hypothetical protein